MTNAPLDGRETDDFGFSIAADELVVDDEMLVGCCSSLNYIKRVIFILI